MLGVIAGPHGISLIVNDGHIDSISNMGIILLMFLLGLHLHPPQSAQAAKANGSRHLFMYYCNRRHDLDSVNRRFSFLNG